MAKVQHTCTGCVPIDASIIDVYVTLVQTNQFVTDAETGRALAEAARVTAENARTATFSEDHSRAVADHTNAQTAINNANAAAAAANAAGITSASASVDSNVGTPSVDVSLVNKQLSLSFHNIKGEKGEKGDRGDGAIPVVNDLVTGGTGAALSAEMGKTLNTTKQATLVSGTNIKTVNGESLLGEGNIVAGDPNAVKYVAQTLTDAQKAQARTNIDAYQKPSTGIPATDLASAAQTSLGKADTAYQKPSGGIPKTDLDSGVQGSLDLADSAIQARPMGEVDPTITPAEYATTEELSELEAKVTEMPIPVKYPNGYINTSGAIGSVVNINTPVINADWKSYVASCKEGDTAIVSGTGGGSPRLWAFLDSDYKIISQSAASITEDRLELTAPANAAWIVVNDNSGKLSYLKVDANLTDIERRLETQEAISDEILPELESGLDELKEETGNYLFTFQTSTDSVQKVGDIHINSGDKIKFKITGTFSADRIMLAADSSLSNRIKDNIEKGVEYEVTVGFDVTQLYVFFSGNFVQGSFNCSVLQNISFVLSDYINSKPSISRVNKYTGNKYPCFVGYGSDSSEESLAGTYNGISSADLYKIFQELYLYGFDNAKLYSIELIRKNTSVFRVRFRTYDGGVWVNDADFEIPISAVAYPGGVSNVSASLSDGRRMEAVIDLSSIPNDTFVQISSSPHYIVAESCFKEDENESTGHYSVNYYDVLLPRNTHYYDQNGVLQSSDARWSNVVLEKDKIVDDVLSLSTNTRGVSGSISAVVYFGENGQVLGTIQKNVLNIFVSDIPEGTMTIGFTFMYPTADGDIICRFTGYKNDLEPWEYAGIINPYKGKTGVVFGDSIINGVGAKVGQDCVETMARVSESTIYNGGIGGTQMLFFNDIVDGIVDNDWSNVDARINYLISQYQGNDIFEVLPTRFQAIKNLDFSKVDFIVVAYGTNDWTANAVRDNQNNEYDTTTVLGSLRDCVRRILTAYPNIEILVVTPSYRCHYANGVIDYDSDGSSWGGETLSSNLGVLADQIAQCAKELKLRCWNQYWDNGVNKFNAPQWLDDGTHRTASGYELLGKQLAGFLKSR